MPAHAPARGFTYLGLIILVAIIGMVGAASLKVGSLLQRAAAEEELLDIGAAFSDALRSYAAATPPGQPQQPPTLQELLRDPRFPSPRRHLRKIFVDPVTGKAEWGVMYLADKVGVLGVHSLSTAKPLKVANFDPRFLNMENKEHLSDWKFTMSSQTMAPGAPLTPPVAPPDGKEPLFPPVVPAPPPVKEDVPEPAPVPEDKPMEPKSDEEKAADDKAAQEEAEKEAAEKEAAEKEAAEKEAAKDAVKVPETGDPKKDTRPDDTRRVIEPKKF